MERDFLGINAKPKLESPQRRDEGRGPASSSATYGNAASQWQFTNMEQPQHFLSFATRQEGESSKFSPSSFQPIPTQRVLVLDTNQLHLSQSTPQYISETMAPYVNQRPSGRASTSLSPRNAPFVGLYQPREVPKQLPSQLTIFYQGSVSVFDNIPLDKAKEIMSLANKASSTPCTPNPTFEQPTKALFKSASFSGGIPVSSKPKQTQRPDHVFEPVMLPPSVSTQMSLAPQAPAGSSSMSAITNESLTTGPSCSVAPVNTAVMVSTTAPDVPRAIPQARKASLARFLEKRKERVIAAMPYPSTAKSAEVIPSKSSSTDLTLSSNNDELSLAGSPKIKNSSQEFPSTKLEI
ncbi:protein TIFY 6b-like isoform X1 [Carex rostrata]